MYLSRLIINNYRSIEFLDLSLSKGKNVIVGRNNAGKSNIIKALDVVLGESSPTYKKFENITVGDFFTQKKGAGFIVAKSLTIACVLTREADEELNMEEINASMGIYKALSQKKYYNQPANDVPLRIEIDFKKEDFHNQIAEVFKYDKDIEDDLNPGFVPDKRWIDSKLKNQLDFSTELGDKYEFMYVFQAHRHENGEISKDLRLLYREDSTKHWVLTLSNSLRNELLQSAVIQSFRDPQSQLRLTNYSWYGKLIRKLTENHGKQGELVKAQEEVKKVAEMIFAGAKSVIQTSALNVAFPNAEIYFQFNEDLKTDIYKDCKIYIDDGIKSPLSEKGSGIQSATIIGLFNLYVSKYNTKTSALLCVEEPELYLHPHARRVISDRLNDFLDGDKNQVVLSTHSPEFINTTSPNVSIALVRNDGVCSYAQSIKVDSFRDILLDNNHNEVFFADKVIICEGYDNYILRWAIEHLHPEWLDGNNVSIVSVGGKNNIPKMVRLLLSLGIDCHVMADFDFFLRDKGDDATKYGAKPHDSIQSLGDRYFSQDCIYGKAGKGVFGKIQKARTEVKSEEEDKFYTAKSVGELVKTNGKIKDGLAQMRQKGTCILDSDIEGLFKDSAFLHEGKVTLNSVFEINKALKLDGKSIDEIINLAQIEEFINGLVSTKS